MIFGIKQLCSYFCLVHSTDPQIADQYFASLRIPKSVKEVLLIITKVKELYNEEIKLVLDKIAESGDFQSREFCKSAILRRCVKLSANPTHWDFILVCALIGTIIKEYFDIFECFTFANIGLQCLLEVYYRCYKDLFKGMDEYQILVFYCRRLNLIPVHEEHASENSFTSPIESLQDADDVNFQFTDSEHVLLDAVMDSVEIGQTFNVATSDSSDSSSSDEASSVDTIIRRCKVCPVCDETCFRVILSFRHELKER